jgi:hypothetical protein
MAGPRRLRATLHRALRRMTDPSAAHAWVPDALGPFAVLVPNEPHTEEADRLRPAADLSSADLRERQRALAFDMYGEALMRIAMQDAERHRSEQRETA